METLSQPQEDDSQRPQRESASGTSDQPGGSLEPTERTQAVRFSSRVDEIEPSLAPQPTADLSQHVYATTDPIRVLTEKLHSSNLQGQRLQSYSFEAVSLPSSRVASNETSANPTPQQSHSPMGHQSPGLNPKPSELASPPLTPAGTLGAEPSTKGVRSGNSFVAGFDSQAITPQASGQESRPQSPRISVPHRPASTEDISQKTTAVEDHDDGVRGHRKAMFSLGGQSLPTSRNSSPSRNRASQFYTKPLTPQGDINDPYAASKRPVQNKIAGTIDSRFVFSRKKKRDSPTASSTNLVAGAKQEKRPSSLFGGKNKPGDLCPESTSQSQHASMADLKRFFKVGPGHKAKKGVSPALSKTGSVASIAKSPYQVPFADDHGLTSKYGKIGRVLGSGAGGSVKLLKRSEDNTIFAVKEFRPRHSYETEKEYVKKVTAEFCIGSALHHGNIIETLDIVQEKGKWYEVMEYAPYDLFATVMTNKMSKAEITCSFLQILSGVTYLHSSGLAHRDLKLDNVVVTAPGIMKIIDFGSAHVFKYPFETETVPASGIVGSDPYLAPEVYDARKYDPQAVDIWSLAIIYCCMMLRRFPWKVPRISDTSFKLFAEKPTPGHDPKKLILPSRSTGDLDSTPQRDIFPEEDGGQSRPKSQHLTPDKSTTETQGPKEVIRGPWRLLRLLPRESRHIIGRMLTIDPNERAKMSEIVEEPWVSDTEICRQVAPGQVTQAEGHSHILEHPTYVPPK